MSTRVKLPDGSFVTVPTDDPKVAARAARTYWEKKSSGKLPTPKPKPKGLVDRYREFDRKLAEYASPLAAEFVEGVLPNWGDELYAAPRAVGAFFRGEDAGKAFDDAQAKYQRRQKNFRENNPKASTAATGTGMVASVGLPAAKLAQGATKAQAAISAGKTAGTYGAIAGAGQGDGFGERLANAATLGAVSAPFGAAMVPVAAAAPRVGNWMRDNIPGVDFLARQPGKLWDRITGQVTPTAGERQANRIAGQTMERGQIRTGADPQATVPSSPRAVEAEVARRNQQGVPAIVGDVTQELRDMTSYAGRGMGPGQSMVRETLQTRQRGSGDRVRGYVQDTMPTTPDGNKFVEDTQQAMKDAARPLYEQAYEQPMYRTPGIQAIEQTPAFRDALPSAYRNIQNQIDPTTGRPKDPQAMGFRWFDGDPNGLPPNVPHFPNPDGPGYIAWDNGLSVEGYDQVIRAMNLAGRGGPVDNITGKMAGTTDTVHINNRARDLRAELTAQNDPYRQAVERYADDSAAVNAFEQGQGVENLLGPEVLAQMRATPDAFRPVWATGAGTRLADKAVEDAAKYPNADIANRVRQSLGDDTKQQAIQAMGGGDVNMAKLQDLLELEKQAHLTYKGVEGGSPTAMRQAIDSDLNSDSGIPTSAGAILGRFIQFAGSKIKPQFKQDVQSRLAEIATASDAKTVSELIQAIEAQAARDANFAKLLNNAGVTLSGLYGRNLEAVYDDQQP